MDYVFILREWGGGETTQKATRKTTQKATQKLSQKQEKILAYLKQNPTASRKELTMHIDDLTEDGVKYNLKRLKALGLIQREGADNGGHWRTTDNGENELSDNDI